ncbi:TlpA family protein disulfide reductase [Olivibacter sp. SA151]|uniref:TlpA family protein disulfide reductase n=1 Tax=Olivibacter jilunii TaxID=985016 RepID=UPI003F140CFB
MIQRISLLSTVLISHLLLNCLLVSAQEDDSVKFTAIEDSVISIRMQKMLGSGPDGNISFSIGVQMDYPEEIKVCNPNVTGIPESIRQATASFLILDNFQFYFQNYIAGKMPKTYFLQEAKKAGWDLKDTLFLSREPLQCVLQFVTGLNDKGEAIFIADINGNNDFSDDAIKRLSSLAHLTYGASPIPVPVDYSESGQILKDTVHIILASHEKDSEGKPMLTITYPEFYYRKIYSNGIPYYLCCGRSIGDPLRLYVVPEQPNFSPMQRDKGYRLGDLIQLNGNSFIFKNSLSHGRIIRLEGKGLGAIQIGQQQPGYADVTRADIDTKSVRNQVGFIAPTVAGTNIIDNKKINTDSLRDRWVFIDFWSTTCGPCIEEFPNLKKLYGTVDKSRVEFIAVVDERRGASLQELMRKHELPWPTLKMGTGTTMEGYDIYSYPTTVLIDPKGKIVRKDIRGEELNNVLQDLQLLQ